MSDPAMLARTVLALTLAVATGCGKDKTGGKADNNAVEEVSPVAACRVATPAALMLQDTAVSYARDLYPIMNGSGGNQGACSRCHSGDDNDADRRPNSTNCLYLRDNLANVILRLNNAVDARQAEDDYRAANPAATDQDIQDAQDAIADGFPDGEKPMPQYPFGNRQPLSQAEIDLFVAWDDSPDKCEEGEPAPELADIPVVESFSDAEAAGLPSAAEVKGCEDGPTVNEDSYWSLVEDQLAGEPEPASAFYDFETHTYVAGATAAPYECTWDEFIGSLSGVDGVASTLGTYRDYGWRLIQCAVADGLPVGGMASLTRVTDLSGSQSVAVVYKTIKIDRGE